MYNNIFKKLIYISQFFFFFYKVLKFNSEIIGKDQFGNPVISVVRFGLYYREIDFGFPNPEFK